MHRPLFENRHTQCSYPAQSTAAPQCTTLLPATNLEMVQSLHAQGASLIARDNDGYCPFRLAVLGGHLEVVKWMVTQECR